jgi:hypothetical protein
MAGNSPMSARNTVVFTTASNETPAAASTAPTLSSTRRVCSVMPPSTTAPVEGSRGIWPEQNRNGPATIAWE